MTSLADKTTDSGWVDKDKVPVGGGAHGFLR